MKLIWLIYGEKEAIKNKYYIQLYQKEGEQLGLKIELKLAEKLEFGIQHNTWYILYEKEKPFLPHFVICRTIYPLISKQLEYMGIPVFNCSFVADICNDKAKTYQYVAQLGISIIDSIFCKKEYFERQIKELKHLTVIKTVVGHGGSEVFLYSPTERMKQKQLLELGCRFDTIIQPVASMTRQDVRVYVIGKEIIGAVLRTGVTGFQSNYSLGGTAVWYELSHIQRNIVNQVISLFEFGMVGIDFIIGDDGSFIFNEIEDVVGARMLYQCSAINLVQKYLLFLLEHN